MRKNKPLTFETTLEVHDRCLCMQLQRAARVTARRFDDALRPLGLTNGQFSILMALNQPEAPTLGRVADILAMDRTTLTANLKPLERRGLVSITPDEKDRRTRRPALTEDGLRLLSEAYPVWQETIEGIEARMGPDSAKDLSAILGALT